MGNKDGIVIIGFGGHAKGVADSIIKGGRYRIAGYTDKEEKDSKFKYLGTDDVMEELYYSGVHNAALGLGYMGKSYVRDALVDKAKKIGFRFPAIIDPSAEVALDADIGEGSFIGKKAVVNEGSRIGNYSIINTGAIVEHENIVGDYSHIAVGAILCGNVSIGSHTMIGAGTVILQERFIGDECMVGARSLILGNVGNNLTVFGTVGEGGGNI